MKREIIPAILVKEKKELLEKLKLVESFVSRVQIDIIDGKFTNNKTISISLLKGLKTKLKLDIHLMVKNPENYVKECKEIRAHTVIFHVESCKDIKEAIDIINKIKNNNMKAGIALNPDTEILMIEDLLGDLDQVLVMGVNPGFSGQELIPETLIKVRALRILSSDIDIGVDGGINVDNIRGVAAAGANLFAVASAVFKGNVKENIKNLKKILR